MTDESHGISALVLHMDFSFDNASINTKYLHCNLRREKYLKSTQKLNQESETHFSRGGHFKIVSLMKFKIVCKKIK